MEKMDTDGQPCVAGRPTTTKTAELAARLRLGEPCAADPCRVMEARSGCLCAEAAAEIERLQAQMERMIVEVSRWSIAASEEMEMLANEKS